MAEQGRRRFSVRIAALLVAAAALGMWPTAHVRQELGESFLQGNPARGLTIALTYATPVLLAWSLGALILGLPTDRPPGSGLILNATGIIGAVVTATYESLRPIWGMKLPYSAAQLYVELAGHRIPMQAGLWTAGALIALVFLGRLRPGPGWPDRFQWAAGMMWIALLILGQTAHWLMLSR